MPSIEIVCVGQMEPLSFEAPFAVASERELVSHRSPTPFFQSDFDALEGCIYHLGSPYLREPEARGYFTAYQLLDWENAPERCLLFRSEFAPDVFQMLARLLRASPEKRVLWTSDYQGGPRPRRMERSISLACFIKRHDEKRLWLNALYTLEGAKKDARSAAST